MTKKEEIIIPLSEAKEQVAIACTRIALLHLAFSKILVEELGVEKGKELILKSIMEYGKRVGERIKRGLPDLPKYGIIGKQLDGKFYDCIFAKTFREYGELNLGCIYCYIDAAKYMAQDPTHKLVHGYCAACGDEYCTFITAATTKKERSDFKFKKLNWKSVDQRLAQGFDGRKKLHLKN